MLCIETNIKTQEYAQAVREFRPPRVWYTAALVVWAFFIKSAVGVGSELDFLFHREREKTMKRIALLLALVPAVAYGFEPGAPQSYYLPGVGTTEVLVVDGVLAGGFVLTDVVAGLATVQALIIAERDGPMDTTSTVRLKVPSAGSTTTTGIRIHLQSGIFFEEGKQIWVYTSTGGNSFTLSGYTPQSIPKGNVPAVGTWGLVALTLLIVSVGSVLIRRRGVA